MNSGQLRDNFVLQGQTKDAAENKETKRSAFVIIFTRELALWKDHAEKTFEQKHATSPAVLMVNRSDYTMGFPGGGLKNGETPRQGAVTELREELGIDFVSESDLRPMTTQTFTNGRGVECTTHCFTLEVSPEHFQDVIRNANKAVHFMAETRGIIPVSMEHPDPKKTFPFQNFLKSPMADAVREDLCHFIQREKLLPAELIKDLIKQDLLIPALPYDDSDAALILDESRL